MASSGRNLIVMGASAGGIETLKKLLAVLDVDLPAAMLGVVHVAQHSEGRIDRVLDTPRLRVRLARDEDAIEMGSLLMAPPNHHIIVKPGQVRLSRGPRENHWRPAIDVLFRSAAVAYRSQVIGVVLSGMLDDGVAGLAAIKRCGGIAIVQHPDEATYPDMAQHAIHNVDVDHVLPVAEIAKLLKALAMQEAGPAPEVPEALLLEATVAEMTSSPELENMHGKLSIQICPECGGPMWTQPGTPVRFRCHVGHAFTAATLLQGEARGIEATLWAAVRLFEQHSHLARSMARQEESTGREKTAAAHEERAQQSESHAEILRKLLLARLN